MNFFLWKHKVNAEWQLKFVDEAEKSKRAEIQNYRD